MWALDLPAAVWMSRQGGRCNIDVQRLRCSTLHTNCPVCNDTGQLVARCQMIGIYQAQLWSQAGGGAWWAAATQLLERETPNSGAEAIAHIRDTLSQSDT